MEEKQAFVGQPLANKMFANPPRPPIELPSTQQLAWLVVRPVSVSLLEEVDRQLLIHVSQDPTINQVYILAKEFAAMVRGHQAEALDDWLIRCQNASTTLLQQFGLRLHRNAEAAEL